MTHQPLTILLPSSAAKRVDHGAPRNERLACAAGGEEFSPAVRVSVLYILAHDPDQDVRNAAVGTLRNLPEIELLEVLSADNIHPCILDALVRLYQDHPDLVDIIALNTATDSSTVDYLAGEGNAVALHRLGQVPLPDLAEDDEEPVDEESEAFLSKYQLAQQMAIGEKIKTALMGDKEWRGLLIKDSNKLVSSAVIKNPRITEPEVLNICKGIVQNDDIIRLICANKEWVKNYQIRKALVTNSKTPLAKAIRYLSTLSDKDIASLAKSKNVSSVISTQARRIISQKQEKR